MGNIAEMLNRVKFTILSGLVSKFASIILTTISIPMMIAYFGTHNYGSLTIVASLVSTIQIIGLSAGGTVSIIGPQLSSHRSISKLLSVILKIYVPYLIGLSLLAIAFYSVALRLLIEKFYHGKIDGSQFEKVFLYSIISLLVSFIALIFQNAFYSIHKVYCMNIYQLMANLASFLALMLTIMMRADIATYSLFVLCGTALVCVVMIIHYLLMLDSNNAVITEDDEKRVTYRNIFATAFLSTLISVIAIAINQTDNLIIPYYMDNDSLVMFSILFRVVTYEMLAYSIVFSTVMPSMGQWFANKDWGNINKMYSIVLTSSTYIGLLIGVFNVFFLQIIVNNWLHKSIQIDSRVVLFLSLYCCVFGIYSSNYIVYSCFNVKRKLQMGVSFIEPTFKVIGSYVLISHWGLLGAASSVLLLAICVTLPVTTILLKYLSGNMVRVRLISLIVPIATFTATLIIMYFVSMMQMPVLKNAIGILVFGAVLILFYRYIHKESGINVKFWRRA